MSINKREVAEVKKKWENLKMTCKSSLNDKLTKSYANKTGGGSPREPLNSHDERMLGILGRTQVIGISGGLDTSDERKLYT